MSALLSSTEILRPGVTRTSGRASGGAFNPAADFAAKLETALAGGDEAVASGDAAAGAKELPPIGGSDYGMYANVVVNGKVVASLTNSGGAMIADGYNVQVPSDGDGPKLARERAEAIAKQLGGTVQLLSTAMSEENWAKTGRSAGKMEWGLDGSEPPGYRPGSPPGDDPLLVAQEARG